jgi:alpha-1,3-rhamnosyltransferase
MQTNPNENFINNISSLKISVIIPIYNHADYVVECLKSVVDQRDENFEIVAIDDGSTDSSYELALDYLRNNLAATHWKLSKRENRGINKTANEGVQNSSGEIIYLLASDDRMTAGSLEKIRQAYLNESERCKLFFYDIATISSEGSLIDQSESSYRRGGAALLGFSKLHLAAQVVLCWGRPFGHQFYSRDYYNKYGPYPENLKYEDLYFAFKAISVDRFVFVPVVLKEYRLRPNLTNTPGLSQFDMSQTYNFVRDEFKGSVRLRYSLLLMLGRFFHRGGGDFFKFLLKMVCALVHRTIFWCSSIRPQLQIK